MKKTFSKNEINGIAKEILRALKQEESATIVALSGDLGTGKTALAQAMARELGVTENVISPTFVIMKSYALPRAECARGFSLLVHIDAYRLNSSSELQKLGWAELISDPKNLILIEWPEKVADIIPKSAHRISLSHENETERYIEM